VQHLVANGLGFCLGQAFDGVKVGRITGHEGAFLQDREDVGQFVCLGKLVYVAEDLLGGEVCEGVLDPIASSVTVQDGYGWLIAVPGGRVVVQVHPFNVAVLGVRARWAVRY
jgi:hypothetical protein